MENIILWIIGITIAIALPFTLGWLRKPKVKICANELPILLSLKHQLLILGVENLQLPSIVSKFLQRHSISCSAKLTFYQKAEAEVYSGGNLIGKEKSAFPCVEFNAVWSTKRFGLTTTRMEPGYYMSPQYEPQTSFNTSVDIASGEKAFIIMPMKEQGDEYCYLCNPADWFLNPDSWKNAAIRLEKSEYELVVAIDCKGMGSLSGKFLLKNRGRNLGEQTFSFEPMPKKGKSKD